MKDRSPIIYDQLMDIRISDLDSYGHLNSAVYLDLVNTSRLLYFERVRGVSMQLCAERGIGFFLSKASQEFLKPISDLGQLRIRSWIREIQRARVSIAFEITDPEQRRAFAKGELECYVMDLKALKPCVAPAWLVDEFFEPARPTS